MCGGTTGTKTPQNRSWAVGFLTAAFALHQWYILSKCWEQCWGMHRMESASINLQISSMWHSSCLRPCPLQCSQYDYSERRGKKKSISCNAASVQNCPNSSQPCQTQQHIHSLGLSVDSIQSGTFWFCLLFFSNFGILLRYCLHFFSVYCQEMTWQRCCPRPLSAKRILVLSSVQKQEICVSSLLYIYSKLQGGRSAVMLHL